MFSNFTIDGQAFTVATYDQVDVLRNEPGAPHVMFACIECGMAYWTAKNLALTPSGHYNGTRNIFFCGKGTECSCNPARLRCIVAA